MRVVPGLKVFGVASLCALAAPLQATTITFDDLANGTVLTDQYSAAGVTFVGAYIAASGGVGGGAHSTNAAPPTLRVDFAAPVYRLFLAVYEFELPPGPPLPDEPPPSDEAPPADAPPADDAKPDASVFPLLTFADGSTRALDTVHALTRWQTINYQGNAGVTQLDLVGDAGAFLIDNLTYSTARVSAPDVVWLLPLGVMGVLGLRRRVGA